MKMDEFRLRLVRLVDCCQRWFRGEEVRFSLVVASTLRLQPLLLDVLVPAPYHVARRQSHVTTMD